MKAFVTGSHVFGNPKEDSDIDLVVRVASLFDLDALIKQSDTHLPTSAFQCQGQFSLRFGNLNLLVTRTDSYYAAWKIATDAARKLRAEKGEPLAKDEYVPLFRRVFGDLELEPA